MESRKRGFEGLKFDWRFLKIRYLYYRVADLFYNMFVSFVDGKGRNIGEGDEIKE